MPYVQRNDNNEIIAIYSMPQPEFAEEYLDADNVEVVNYLASLVPPP